MHRPATPRKDDAPPRVRSPALYVLSALGPITLLALAVRPGDVGSYLPVAAYDLALSFARMVIAYAFSLAFALTYGYFAAVHRTGERTLIPVLDILQSVPILGFFPVALVFFVHLSGPGSWLGPNLASIFLIFTSMSWNMAFGVYESLKGLPGDLREAADAFGVSGWARIRSVLFPATANRLVYNSVLSWTAGWYYLVAAELFSVGASRTELPGIGSFLLAQGAAGSVAGLIAGLALLIALVTVLDLVLWRPLGRWAERFRYDVTPSGRTASGLSGRRPLVLPLRRAAGIVARGMRSGVGRMAAPLASLSIFAPNSRRTPRPFARAAARTVGLGILLVLVWLLLIAIIVAAGRVLTGPIDATVRGQIELVPLALAASLGRVSLAYLLCLLISLPLAIALVGRPRLYKVGLPVVEIIASVPATSIFPLFIFALVPTIGLEAVAVLMVMTGMIWYLFFNTLSGLRSIPPDLEEATRSLGLSRRGRYRRLVLPAILPAVITGSITAFGGGWNTLILAEYVGYGVPGAAHVLGIGALLDLGNAESPAGAPLLVVALVTLVITVVALNELIWKPLYRRAVERYRYD